MKRVFYAIKAGSKTSKPGIKNKYQTGARGRRRKMGSFFCLLALTWLDDLGPPVGILVLIAA